MSNGGLPTTYQRKARQLLLPLIVVQPLVLISVGIIKEIDKIIELDHHSQSQQSSTPRRANKSSSQLWARENAYNQIAANCNFYLMYAVWCEIFCTNYKVLLKNQCIHYRIESCCICFPCPELDFLDERTDRQEDTESLSSTATSEKSCKHSQSDSVQSETKGKPVANNLTSLPHTIDSLVPVSEEREKELLLKINSYPKAVYHDPVARRFRRKLILRQVRLFQYPL